MHAQVDADVRVSRPPLLFEFAQEVVDTARAQSRLPRSRSSSPPPGPCTGRRCRCSRSPRPRSRPASPPSARTGRGCTRRGRFPAACARRASPCAPACRAWPAGRRRSRGAASSRGRRGSRGTSVSSAMSFTGSPASARAFFVPPVAISSTPYFGDQFAGEIDEAGLVGDAEQGTADRTEHGILRER